MRIRALSFTGSTRTGRAVQIASAQSNLKKVVFELESNGPALIFDDADLEEATRATEFSIKWNSGQTCMANSWTYVPEGAANKFLEILKKFANSRRMSDLKNPQVNHGS